MRVKNSRQKKFLAVVVALFIIAVLYIINYIATYNTYHFSEKLVDAISSGNAKKVEKVLNDYPNGDVNKTEYRTNIIPILLQTNNNYPIQEACLEGNLKIIKLIRDRGAELNVVSGTTNDPLLFNVVYQRWPDKDSIRITEYLIS